jgi:hypothetical protein
MGWDDPAGRMRPSGVILLKLLDEGFSEAISVLPLPIKK